MCLSLSLSVSMIKINILLLLACLLVLVLLVFMFLSDGLLKNNCILKLLFIRCVETVLLNLKLLSIYDDPFTSFDVFCF